MKRSFGKRFMSAALSTVFAFTSAMIVMPPPVHAEENNYLYTDDGFAYIVNDEGTITLKGRDKSREDEYDKTRIVLPSKIDGKYVTEIDTNYFGHSTYGSNSTVTEIVLPDHIEKINNWCFNDYKTLDTLVIPATLKEAARPFTYCKINKVIIEDGMETVPNSLFSWTDYMGELVIPDSVTAIGDDAFNSITGLKEIHVPDSVKSIGYCAIANNPDLEVLDLPDTLDFIDNCAFTNNPKLTSVTVPDTWTFGEGKNGFFSRCGIKEISFGPDRTEIPQNICQYCENLETINWPDAPMVIGPGAFADCISIKDPKIPDSVETIYDSAFSGCTGIENLDLPASLTYLGNRAFRYTENLKYLYVPMQLPAVGNYHECTAFWQSGIEKLVIGDGITQINAIFSSGMPKLTEIVIPDSVTSINSYAFSDDESLAYIDLHEGITDIAWQSVFSNCHSLKEITVPSTLTGETGCFASAPALETITIPEGWTEIPAKMFNNCEALKKVVIPESVTKINTLAFSRCYELETVEAPREEYEIENGAFSYCNNLWDERFSIAKKGDLFITKSSPSNAAGDITNYTVYYSINPRLLDTFGTANLNVSVQPWKHLVIDESLPDGLTAGDVGFKVDLGSPTGIFRFSVRNPEDSTVKVNAEFSAKAFTPQSYEWDTKQLVITDTKFEPLTINAPDTVSIKDGKSAFSIYGYAPIGEKVTVMVNGEENTTVYSNEYTGKYNAQIECEPANGIITVQAVCGDNRSDKKQISVDEAMPVLVDFDVTHYTHGTDHWTKDLTDMFRTGYSPFVPINPSRPFEFDVEMDNEDNVYKVLIASKTAGKSSFVPLERDNETGRWTGSGQFDTTIPGELSVKAIPKQVSDVLTVGKDNDGNATLTNKAGKDLIDMSDQKDPDPVDEFIKEFKPTVEEAGPKKKAVKFEGSEGYYPPPDYWDESETKWDPVIKYVEYVDDSISIGGEIITADEIMESPEEYGFEESLTTVKDEEGVEYSYYVRYLTSYEQDKKVAKEVTENMSLETIRQSVYDYLTNNGADMISMEGILLLQKNIETNETSIVSQFFSAGDGLLKDEVAGAGVSVFIEKFVEKCYQTSANRATVAGAVIQNLTDMYGYYYKYSDRLEQIDYSKNPETKKNAEKLRSAATNLFLGRAAVAVYGIAGTAAVATGGLALVPALLAGATITFGAWCWGKLLDWEEEELDSNLYTATPKGELKAGIDPSGYVYAAIPDNRIEGATATIYYKDENGNAVKWNAEDYDQINPQITDSAGWFMWDVPEGLWQVRIEAEGYETYSTEWLPVLPVQTDVNIPLKSKTAAKIESIDAYANGVQIKMSQFITDSTAVEDNVYLTDGNGDVIPCKIRFSKSENNDTGFSDIITLISDKEDISGAKLHIESGLLSYSGIPSEASDNKIGKVKDSLIVDPDPDVLLGDVNNDGEINAVDASSVLAYYAMTSTNNDGGYDENQKLAADVNHDGDINAVDASNILAYYAYVATTPEGEVKTMEEYMKK